MNTADLATLAEPTAVATPAAPAELVAGDAHDEALLANVHPAHWTNPTAADRYQLVVIGAGTGGLVSAAIAAALGARVALVERHLMGGDCLNVGCVPSKAMLRAARAWAEARTAAERFGGPRAGDGEDFGAAMERMRRLRAGLSPTDGAARFRGLGVDVFLGDARFVGPEAVAVGGQTLRFRRAIVATGGRPAVPRVDGLGRGDDAPRSAALVAGTTTAAAVVAHPPRAMTTEPAKRVAPPAPRAVKHGISPVVLVVLIVVVFVGARRWRRRG